MKTLGKILVLALGFGALAVVLTLVTNRRASAQGPPNGLNVNVVNTPLEVTGNISLSGNSVATPLLIRDVDNLARRPFDDSNFSTCTGQTCNVTFAVPPGKLLVIETVTANLQLPPGQRATVGVFASASGGLNSDLPVEFQGTFTSGQLVVPGDDYSAAAPLRFYANPGTTVRVGALRNGSTGSFVLGAAIVGYLVDCPAGSNCLLP
jgi:hypothetical protein